MCMDLNRIGRFIFKLRTEKGLSQRNLAEMIPVTRQAVSRWEQGKSLPDSQTLILLSEIFEVTIDELLAGKRNVEEIKSEITLNLVDEYNNKKKIIKITTIVSVIIILLILIIFLGYYFINSYNSIKVYKINGDNGSSYTNNGIMISTKQKSYIRIGEIITERENKDIKKVRLIYKNKDNKRKVLYEDNKTNILITSYYGYNESFSIEDLDYIIKSLYLEIDYGNGTEKVKLKVEKDFANNLWIYPKKEKVIHDKDFKHITSKTYTKIKESIIEKGTKGENNFKYEVNNDEEKINFYILNNEIFVEAINGEYRESWYCNYNYAFSFFYTKYENNEEIERKAVMIKEDEKLGENEEIYIRLIEYINKYLTNIG